MKNLKTVTISDGEDLTSLVATINDFEDFGNFSEYKAIIQERGKDRNFNRSKHTYYWLIEGESLEDAINNFNEDPSHDMLIDMNDPEFTLFYEQHQ